MSEILGGEGTAANVRALLAELESAAAGLPFEEGSLDGKWQVRSHTVVHITVCSLFRMSLYPLLRINRGMPFGLRHKSDDVIT